MPNLLISTCLRPNFPMVDLQRGGKGFIRYCSSIAAPETDHITSIKPHWGHYSDNISWLTCCKIILIEYYPIWFKLCIRDNLTRWCQTSKTKSRGNMLDIPACYPSINYQLQRLCLFVAPWESYDKWCYRMIWHIGPVTNDQMRHEW